VEGDAITTITPSEHDAGYSLNYEARATANKLNQAVKTIRAYRKRIKACHVHKSKGLKQEPNDPSGPNLDDKIEELETAIRSAETEKAKCEARLNKLREGGVTVDEYLDAASLAILETENQEQQPEWGAASSNGTASQVDTPQTEVAAAIERQTSNNAAGAPRENGEWDGRSENEDDDEDSGGQWGELASQAAAKAKQRALASAADDGWADSSGWDNQESADGNDDDGGAPQQAVGSGGEAGDRQALAPEDIDPNAAIWRAVVLFNFEANNEDELSVVENEEVDIMVRECDEEGWLMGRNKAGRRGYVPYNYVEVFACLAEDDSVEEKQPQVNRTNSYRHGGPHWGKTWSLSLPLKVRLFSHLLTCLKYHKISVIMDQECGHLALKH
jgi:hypothetical protein